MGKVKRILNLVGLVILLGVCMGIQTSDGGEIQKSMTYILNPETNEITVIQGDEIQNGTKGGVMRTASVGTYSATLTGDDSNRNNFTYGIITVGDYVIMDRNLGARTACDSITWTDNSASYNTASDCYGYYYQWGNNWGFSSNTTTGLSSTKTVSSNQMPSKYTNSIRTKVNPWDNGSSSNNYNYDLWGHVTNTEVARQGPCPDGWHVPSTTEWTNLRSAWCTSKGYGSSCNNGSEFVQDLKLPIAGGRNYSDMSFYARGSYGTYWASTSNNSDWACLLDVRTSTISTSICDSGRSRGRSVRCFMNSGYFTLTLNANGGTVAKSTLTGAAITLPGATRTPDSNGERVFEGWFASVGQSVKIGNSGDVISLTGNKTIYAHWAQTITISNPANLSQGFTILDRNLGAVNNDISSTGSYGFKYQWGNNYGFLDSATSGEILTNVGLTWSDSYNDSGYYSTKFINGNNIYKDVWSDGSHHDDVWGGSGDKSSNNRGLNMISTTVEDRQGPCPDGYHVPSAGEWSKLIEYWAADYTGNRGGTVTLKMDQNLKYFTGNSTAEETFKSDLRLPLVGYRDVGALLYFQGYWGNYWSSSPLGRQNSGSAYIFFLSDFYDEVSVGGASFRAYGNSVRCFKNEYEYVTASPEIVFTGATPNNYAWQTQNYFTGEMEITTTNLSGFTGIFSGNQVSLYDDSLVLMYNLDKVTALGESTTVVKDLSKYGNNGTVNGNAVWTGAGKYGGAFNFSGGTINAGNATSLRATKNFTVNVWIKTSSTYTSNCYFIARYDSNNAKRVWGLMIPSSKKVLGFYGSTNGSSANVSWSSGSTQIVDGKWHMITMTHDGATIRFYVDGKFEGSKANTALYNTGTDLVLNNSATFNGQIDEVRMYTRALSATEIDMLYHSNLSKTASDKWYYSMSYTGLADGEYSYGGSAIDSVGQSVSASRILNIGNRTLTLNANGGSVTPTTLTGAAITLPGATRTGDSNGERVFEGWFNSTGYSEKLGNSGDTITLTGDRTLYAHWAQTITISSPTNRSEGFTILDRNLGAITGNINLTGSYGFQYQWGNNYGFLWNVTPNTTTGRVVWSGSYNNSNYSSSIFVRNPDGNFVLPYASYGNDYWSGATHDGVWGGAGDSTGNNRGLDTISTTVENRQGPCPEGYHVPSAGEWNKLLEYWAADYTGQGGNVSLSYGNKLGGFTGYADAKLVFMQRFNLPLAGWRNTTSISSEQGSNGYYWTSSPRSSLSGNSWALSIGSSNVSAKTYGPRMGGNSVRCFKNEYVSHKVPSYISMDIMSDDGEVTIEVDVPEDAGMYLDAEPETLSASFEISSVPPSISVSVDDILYGDKAVIRVSIPEDALGAVTVMIDGKSYTRDVLNGRAVIVVPDLGTGNYTIDVSYSGDDKYAPVTGTTNFELSVSTGQNEISTHNDILFGTPSIAGEHIHSTGTNFSMDITTDGDDVTFDITDFTESAQNVLFEIDGILYYANFTDGHANWVLQDIAGGNHDIAVSYPVNFGTVLIDVDGVGYVANVTDGRAVISIPFLAGGNHDVVARYSGDGKYLESEPVTGSFTISDVPSYVSVSVDDITYGDKAIIQVSVPYDAVGTVTVVIDGKSYTGDVVNGIAIFVIPDLGAGNYTVDATYSGDEKYAPSTGTTVFEVSKAQCTITVTSKNIVEGKDEMITVNVPGDATGRVFAIINGVVYTGTILNGKAKIVISDLPAGNYPAVLVTYEGDENYEPATTTAPSFHVTPVQKTLTFNATENGASGTIQTSITRDKGTTVSLPTCNEIRSGGYICVGWNTDPTAHEGLTSVILNENMTVYAIFSKTATVTFEPENESGSTVVEVVSGSTVTEPAPAPTRDGYTLKGRYLSGSSSAFDFTGTAITGDITLYAKWHDNRCPEGYDEYDETLGICYNLDTTYTVPVYYGTDLNHTYSGSQIGTITVKIDTGTYSGQTLTMMDMNLGASVAGTGYQSYGYHYQWGNNAPFEMTCTSDTSCSDGSSFSSGSSYGENPMYENYRPGHWYSNSTFVPSRGYYWRSELYYDRLRGGIGDDTSGDFGGINNGDTRQGPCPDGYHVPSIMEWRTLMQYLSCSVAPSSEECYMNLTLDSPDVLMFCEIFKLPMAGLRNYSDASLSTQGYYSMYWSSSPANSYDSRPYYLSLSSYAEVRSSSYRSVGASVRCFKDSPDAPETKVLTFHEHGGDLLGATGTIAGQKTLIQKVESGSVALEPIAPTKSGNMVFSRWTVGESAQTQTFDFSTPVIGSRTLYAQYVCDTGFAMVDGLCIELFTVTFDSNSGSLVASQSVISGNTASRPIPDPTKSGYTLKRRYLSGSQSAFDFTGTAITGDITLYAKWHDNRCPAQYDDYDETLGICYNLDTTNIVSVYYGVDLVHTYSGNQIGTITLKRSKGMPLTMMDMNLGATEVWNGLTGDGVNTGSYGYHYQWGNNYGFAHSLTTGANPENFSTTRVVYENYRPGHRYNNSIFIRGREYWQTSLRYINLRGGSVDSEANDWGSIYNGDVRQGPCPEGYHVPSAREWDNLLQLFVSDPGIQQKLSGTGLHSLTGDSINVSRFQNAFKLPFAGIRHYTTTSLLNQGSGGYYWSSSPRQSSTAFELFLDSSNVYTNKGDFFNYGFSVRCFKDSIYKPETNIVTFYENGGDLLGATGAIVGQKTLIQKVASGNVAVQPIAPTKVGAIFSGWTTDQAGVKRFDFSKPVVDSMALYGQYTCDSANHYVDDGNGACVTGVTVTFDSNGGSSVSPQLVVSGSTVTEPAPAPTRDGYTLKGRYLSGSSSAFDFTGTAITGDITLYAKWHDNRCPAGYDDYDEELGICYNLDTTYTVPVYYGTDLNHTYSGSQIGTITVKINTGTYSGQTLTMMDMNLGASVAGTGVDSYGYHYQWGNNYGFSQSLTTGANPEYFSTDMAIFENYWPGHWYNNPTFIYGTGDYWENNLHYSHLRGGTGDSSDNNRGGVDNGDTRQGPCPDGYHVPSAMEWDTLLQYFASSVDQPLTQTGDFHYFGSGTNRAKFQNAFKLPFAGYRDNLDASLKGQASKGYYWSSSPISLHSTLARRINLDLTSVLAYYRNYKTFGMSIRCFKDSPDAPETNIVTFHEHGGDLLGATGTTAGQKTLIQKVESGSVAVQPVAPTKVGANFSKWTVGESAATATFDFSTPVTVSRTLYAQYVCDPANHYVDDGNGGCVCDATNHYVDDGSGGCEISKDIVIRATATEANQTLKINKYFANAYKVDWGDGTTGNLTADTTHTYATSGTYTITLTLSGADRWTFKSVSKPLVPKNGTTMTGVKIVYMPSLVEGFGSGAMAPGDYFFSYFNSNGAITSLPEGSFDTSKITTAGYYFFRFFNNNGIMITLPDNSFDTSKITQVGNDFFSYFNNNGAITNLPEGSFDTSKIIQVENGFFSSFNKDGAITSLSTGSFKLSTGLIIVGNDFFSYFNNNGAITNLPEGSFDTSNIIQVENGFFSSFNSNGALTSLPTGSFDTSKITTVGSYFFSNFNNNGTITSLPEGSFRLSTGLIIVGNYFFSSFNSNGAITSLPEGSFDISKITQVGDVFFSSFNSHGKLTSLSTGSFRLSTGLTTVGNSFFSNFNYNGKLTSLPEGSFDTSKITTVGDNFFYTFNYSGAMANLPEGSFDTSNITTVGYHFFRSFNYSGAIISLPESFKLSSTGATGTGGYYDAFNSNTKLQNIKVSDLVAGIDVPWDDRNTFSDNQPGRCGVHENWLVSTANACSITYDSNGGSEITNPTKKYTANTTGVLVGSGITAPSMSGYMLDGWYTQSGERVDEVLFPEMDGQTLYARWDIDKRIILEATSTSANQTLKINKYFSNAYTVDWGDGTTGNLTADTTHTYATSGTYTITLTLSGATRWTFKNVTKSLVPQDGTSMTGVKIVYMPSLSGAFGNSATVLGSYFFTYFNDSGAIESLPEGSFDTSYITVITGESFFRRFNSYGLLTSLPDNSFNISNIRTVGDRFFYGFNYGGALISLPIGSFNTENITTIGLSFFQNFNMAGSLTSLPGGSFRFATGLTTATDDFFSHFNQAGSLESLPAGSFNTENITTFAGSGFLGFNRRGALTSLPTGSFNTSNLTSVENDFCRSFNNQGAITTLPDNSFNISNLTSVGDSFFRAFNYNQGALTSLPDGSFDTSNITTAGDYFFYKFNNNGAITNLPDSFTMNSVGASVTGGYGSAFSSPSYTINRKVSDLVDGMIPPSVDMDTFSDNQPGRCGVHENWLVSTANACSITYDSNGGSEIINPTKKYTANTTGVLVGSGITAPSMSGYMLDGWYTQSGERVDEVLFPEMDGQTLYARWNEIYIITYNLDGGVETVANPTTYTIASETITLQQPTRLGYVFLGWTGSNGDEPQTSVTIPAGSYGNKVYNAVWQPNTYSISYILNGGTYGVNHPTLATYDIGFTVTNPTKAGYTFSGWKITGMDSVTHTIGTGTTTATGIARTKETDFKNLNSTSGAIVTFEALWTANTNTQYIVYHYVKRAGTGTYELSELEIGYGTTDTVLTLSGLASTGFTCAHYDSGSLTGSESGPGEIVTGAKINGDGTTKIYLYYVRDYYRVTLSGDAHVDALKINGVEREEAYLECGSDVPVEAVPKPGYHFVRWREE